MPDIRGVAKLGRGPDTVQWVERPWHGPASGQVTVEVQAVGVCGTDLHIARDEYPSVPPVTMGHEIAGVVVALGPDVDESWLSARVVCETYFDTCERCDMCRDGRRNLCSSRRSVGSGVDGGFASRVVIPALNLHRVPDGVSEMGAALAEPLACVCQCLLDPSVINTGDQVLVVGPGPMGLLAAQVARDQGGEVTVVGLPADAERLAAAERLGFSVRTDIPPSDQFPVVVECSGSEGGARVAMTAAARGGRYVGVGIFGAPVTVPLDLMLYKELTFSSGFASTPRSWRRAIALMSAGRIDLDALVSHVLPLSAWAEAFRLASEGAALKVVFDPRLD